MSYPEIDKNSIDVVEDHIFEYDPAILQLLLEDKSTKKNILWATNGYEENGPGYEEFSEIVPELITGAHTLLIQPRSAKTAEIQETRTREKAEVFTPSWVCNKQNNLIDAQWFGHVNVFNMETEKGWQAIDRKIEFPSEKRTWKKYVDAQRLEITCGEAPYLVSRYDNVTGEIIPLKERIGLFDRKMRVVEENAGSDDDWIIWSIRAVQSVFGYEYQGDNLLLARENLILSYIDYFSNHFGHAPDHKLLKKIANIIAWNLWQMDGLKYVVPNSCHKTAADQLSLLDDIQEPEECYGCKTGDPHRHNGIYCKIKDWRSNCSVRFIDMMKGAEV